MIGHYLLTLCPYAEHDVLTGKMRPGNYGDEFERCLVGWAASLTDEGFVDGGRYWLSKNTAWMRMPIVTEVLFGRRDCVEYRYDDLCARFGTERINAAIRNRILSNQARRVLAAVREVAVV